MAGQFRNIKSEKSACEPCRRLKTKLEEAKAASKYCTYCAEAICDICFDHHQASKASSDHIIIDNWEETHENDEDFRLCSIFCIKHQNRKLELFCKGHAILCCLKCVTESHRQCDEIITLDEAAIGVKNSILCSDILENLDKSRVEMSKSIEKGKASIVLCQEQARRATGTVDRAREKVDRHLDYLQENFKHDFSCFCKETINKMESKMKKFEKQTTLVKKYKDILKNKIGNSSEVDVLIEANRLKTVCSETENFIENKDNVIPDLQINFKLNECLEHFTNHFPQLGTYEVQTFNSSGTTLADVVLDLKQSVKLLEKSCITGLKFLQDGNMALIDSRFNALYFYGIEAKKIVEIGLPESPWDVELWDKNILLVSFQERPYLQFVDIIKRKLQKELQIDEPKRGIAVYSNQIFLSSKSKISNLDSSGKEQYSFQADDPLYICVDGLGRLYFREQSTKLKCTDLNGHVIFTYTHPHLKAITGITCDSENNVYAAGFSSHNIHQISPNGKLIKIHSDGIQKPRSIFLEKNKNLLLVSCNEGKEVRIFNLQSSSDDTHCLQSD